MFELAPDRRATLRALSHPIKPVVWIGVAGLSEAVIHELDLALKNHELIKIRVANDDRETREVLLKQICERLEAAPIRHTGRMLVIYRPAPDREIGDNTRNITGKEPPAKKKRSVLAPENKDATGKGKKKSSPARRTGNH